MILTIAEDFTSAVTLDSELSGSPDGGMYLNSGVHPSITVQNLLDFLPNVDLTPTDYSAGTTYGKFTDSRKFTDIVTYSGAIYQSIAAANIGNTPDASPNEWLLTDLDSIRIKSFALRSQDAALKKISLVRRLVDNQYLYNVAEIQDAVTTTLPSDYAGWVFEPRGSDYVRIRLNQVALQAPTAAPQNLYVINQGQLITTLTLNPNAAGRLEFEDVGYSFYGKGKWIFAIDSQDVLTNGSAVDVLKNDGFLAYTCTGIGATPEGATYSYGTSNNGLNFNISAYFDGGIYITNNLEHYASYLQSAWELDVLNMYLSNAHNRSNRVERVQFDRALLVAETKERNAGSVLSKFERERDRALKAMEKTFDRQLNDNHEFEIEVNSY